MYTSSALSVIDAPLIGLYSGFVVVISGFVNIQKIFDTLFRSVVVGSNVIACPSTLAISFFFTFFFVSVSLSLGGFDLRFHFVCSHFRIHFADCVYLLGLSHSWAVLSVWHGLHMQFFNF